MQRDKELVRRILKAIIQNQTPGKAISISIAGYDIKTLYFHVQMLADAGFIKAEPKNITPRSTAINNVYRCTWQGYDLLESLESKSS